MNQQLRKQKQAVRAFISDEIFYPDANLAILLANAQDGHVAFMNCEKCLLGLSSMGRRNRLCSATEIHQGYVESRAEDAFAAFGYGDDPKRRRILIPMIKAEMRRRSLAHCTENGQVSEAPSLVTA